MRPVPVMANAKPCWSGEFFLTGAEEDGAFQPQRALLPARRPVRQSLTKTPSQPTHVDISPLGGQSCCGEPIQAPAARVTRLAASGIAFVDPSPGCAEHEIKEPPCPHEDVVELLLLLSGSQLAVINTVAVRQGVTVGRLLRRLICEYLAEWPDHAPSAGSLGPAVRDH